MTGSENHQDPCKQEADSSESDKRKNAEIQPSLGVGHSIAPSPIGNEGQSSEIADLEKREKWEFRFTLIIAFSAIVSASVAYLQWHTMDRQLDEIRGNGEQTDRLIAQVTEQTRAANELAKIARESLDESRRQFQQDRRPYVRIHATPIQFEPNKAILVNLYSGNFGRSLAVKVGGSGDIFVGSDALEQAYRWFDTEAKTVFVKRTETIIPPGITPSHNDAIRSTLSTRRAIYEKEFKSLTARNFSIVVAFRQAYLDTAGNTYWTDICIGYLTSNAIAYCPQHNKIE